MVRFTLSGRGTGMPGGNAPVQPQPPPGPDGGNGDEPGEDPPPPDPPEPPPPAPPEAQTKSQRIRIASYNIISGRQARLEMALRAMDKMNIDLGFLLEAKVTDGIYTRRFEDYSVVATNATSHRQGGVALFYRNSECYQVESIARH